MLSLAAAAAAQMFPVRPMEGEFVIDEGNLIQPADREQIKQISAALLKERGNPIIVVTIPSLAKYGGSDIDSYALGMFNAWGIGARVQSKGILLLVAVADRKARIELGEGYAHTQDTLATEIMQEIIVPKFKNQEYSAGIRDGVHALDNLARGMPVKAAPWWYAALFWGLIILGILAAISLIRSGRSGWGWLLLTLIFFTIIGIFVMGGRGKGTSFGGGRGGGGGATGSW
ncbi:MAG: TPM domain-containing protein [Acidobacteria bacterium]|nr:TPM domain-containing protein [Acidobacteriota bacterium]